MSQPQRANGGQFATKVYRFAHVAVFYLGQPLTAVVSIVAPLLIKRHDAASQWAALLLSSLITYCAVYFMARGAKAKARAYLVANDLFDLEQERPKDQ